MICCDSLNFSIKLKVLLVSFVSSCHFHRVNFRFPLFNSTNRITTDIGNRNEFTDVNGFNDECYHNVPNVFPRNIVIVEVYIPRYSRKF